MGVTGAMLMREEEGVAGAGPEKEVEEVTVQEGQWRRIVRTLFLVLQQLMESTVFDVDFIISQCICV